jgi:hypothetical protein
LYHKKGRRGRNVVMPINYRDVAPIQDEEGWDGQTHYELQVAE